MEMQGKSYLTTEEAASYLRIGERKLYDLVAGGAVPCTKAAGKWLFPRAALDRWLEAGMIRPAGLAPALPPPVIGGSHDLLLEWAARRSGCGLGLLSEGSEAGLRRLCADEVSIAAIHLHGDDEADANVAAVRGLPELADCVLIAFVRREQGLVLAPGNPLQIGGLADAAAAGARFGMRQKGAGAQLLLRSLSAAAGLPDAAFNITGEPFASGQDLGFAIRAGDIDCGLASRAVANAHGLAFVPLQWERFDLAVRRRTFFEPGPQRLFAMLRDPGFARQAQRLGGYDPSEAGTVRLNR